MTDVQKPPTPTSPPSAASPRRRDDREEGGRPIRLMILGGLVALLGISGGWPMLVVVAGVVIMIFLHELGHYLAAKWGGMKVTEFFIGFGPKIWSFRRGETEYGIKAIPAGAYVKVIGMNNLDDADPADEHRTYRSKSYPKRMLVAVAGSAMHFGQALVLLFLLYAVVGIPGGGLLEDRAWEVAEVVPDSAAAAAGLETGDKVTEIDGRTIETFTALRDEVGDRPGDDVVLTVRRDGDERPVPLTIGTAPDDPSRGLIGIRSELVNATVGPVEAVTRSVSEFGEQSALTLGFLGDFFSPSGISDFAESVTRGEDNSTVRTSGARDGAAADGDGDVAGEFDEGRIISIVGAVQIGSNLTENGILGFLVFFIGINITIGIINLAPFPPLDGGHVVIATYERIREFTRPKGERYHVDFTRLIPVVYVMIALLGMLFVSTVFLDLVDPV